MSKTFMIVAGLVLSAVGMSAATIDFDLRSGNGTGDGTGRVFTDLGSGITVTATAWSLLGYGSTFSAAQLGQFSTGLGVCNGNEGLGCGSPDHQVDNAGSYDFVLFQFSAAVTIQSIVIDPYAPATADRDVTYYASNKVNPIPLGLTNLAGLPGLGFGSAVNQDASAGLGPLPVSIASGPYRAILFGASTTGTDSNDFFKIAGVAVDYTKVPEPSTGLLLGGALLVAGMIRRSRKTCA